MTAKPNKNNPIIKLLFTCAANPLYIPKAINPENTKPRKTQIAGLILCLTVSVSLFPSIFGYFRFTIIPIVSASNGASIVTNNTKIVLTISNIYNEL